MTHSINQIASKKGPKVPDQQDYEHNPQAIEKDSFRQIRELTDLSSLTQDQQQVVMRVVHSLGLPDVAGSVRFSANATQAGRQALANNGAILCDVEMVKQGVTKRMIEREPLCFLNDPTVAMLAKNRNETRSMAALSLWTDSLAGSVVLIGNAPTALFRLLEMIEQGAPKPALIIGMPVGFVGAAESKQALWDAHEKLGIECITLLGRMGGSAVTSASCNALLRCNLGEYY
ncbi:precorrin-8X methylmutase [Marinomonas pollencensis]|uniref:Precorrin-8X methylmutase n=1 Tax=Marinomonas pollencensis TaxID=491954 RepID=A0A3E0DHY5_9GAMM|nr:precorrin-8X methylmutase [Marinomonas pollencensis]